METADHNYDTRAAGTLSALDLKTSQWQRSITRQATAAPLHTTHQPQQYQVEIISRSGYRKHIRHLYPNYHYSVTLYKLVLCSYIPITAIMLPLSTTFHKHSPGYKLDICQYDEWSPTQWCWPNFMGPKKEWKTLMKKCHEGSFYV